MKQQAVRFCEGCGKVCDEIGPRKDALRWIDLREFQMAYGFKPDDLVMTHTYCPGCKECVQSMTQEPKARRP